MDKESRAKIIDELREDARRTFSSIGRTHEMPSSTVFNRYNRLVEKGVIKKHTSLLDFEKLGWALRAWFFINTEDKEETEFFLKDSEFVNNVFLIDTYDYCVEAIFRNKKEMEEFKKDIDSYSVGEFRFHEVTKVLEQEKTKMKQNSGEEGLLFTP